jgi:hypothetical protein
MNIRYSYYSMIEIAWRIKAVRRDLLNYENKLKTFKQKKIMTSINMFEAVLLIFCTLFIVSIFSGCSGPNPGILGTWQSTESNEPGHTITFERNGDAILRDLEGRAVKLFIYEIDGDQLTMKDSGVETTWTFILTGDELIISAGGLQTSYNKVK